MNWQEVERRVGEIAAIARDNEMAHVAEDELWHDVLQAIASGADDPEKLAVEALHTRDLDFCRWYE